MKKICLLGATGSVGTNTIQVVQSYPNLFEIVAFSFHENERKGRKLIELLKPKVVAVKSQEMAQRLKLDYPKVRFTYEEEGLSELVVIEEVDTVVTALMGSIGLVPTLTAIEAGKEIALANKETLVIAGDLVMGLASKKNVKIFPLDSEHSAIFQCLQGENINHVSQLLITASGGSFRDYSRADLANVSVADALNHPNWSMGEKITVDSASMMNKGLEVIEARWLFDMDYDKIKILLHRESIVHSLVQFVDGTIKAQLGASDMREPIQYALGFPERMPIKEPHFFDLAAIGQLHFEEMDFQRFPLLQLAFDTGRIGGTAPTVMNAANEIAVKAFIQKKISFLDIERLVYKAVYQEKELQKPDLAILLEVDKDTREKVLSWI
ncbi:1-deoxy-D-xylulose-5-phosphate reductoisomerase [Carnobacterium funditum]|uniref:1-deoxy-D-xylulose-5-phosphate reductoisomerase n=1 Tax=Carnobacterium funditum TaxID=2752 RepID=UPI0005564D78|nr:1-deoxy-D-xylulose-5-phosphate reductoisomerase [Carnobacterium funditum]